MGRVVVACVVLVLLLAGCGPAGCGPGADDEVSGYLLYEDSTRVEGIYFVHFVQEEDGPIRGWMHTAYPASNPGEPGVYFDTYEVDGRADGASILVRQVSGTGYTDYQGTIEGDQMRLTRSVRGDLSTYEGAEATMADFGAAAQALAIEEQ